MARSETGDVDFNDFSHGRGDAAASATLSDRAVSFRFVVTLKCLSIPLDSGQTATESVQAIGLAERPRTAPIVVAPLATPAPPVISVVVSASPLTPLPVVPEPSGSPAPPEVPAPVRETASLTPVAAPTSSSTGLPWELAAPEFRLESVVPAVLRAFKKPPPEAAPVTAPTPAREPAPPPNAVSFPAPAESGPLTTAPLSASLLEPKLYTAPARTVNWKLVAVALAAVAIAILIGIWWRAARRPAHTDRPVAQTQAKSATNDAQTSIESGDWVRQAAVGGDPGVKETRQLVFYKPSLKATNGRIEFNWSTDSGDVGLVFRAKNLGNYYAVRLKVLNPRSAPTLDVEYFSVYRFVESAHTEKFLVISKLAPILRVRLDVVGPSFTLYLQDNATEYWTDVRMTSGALGFFEEWNRAPQVNTVRISLVQQSELFRKPPAQALEFLARNEPPVLARARSSKL